MLPKYNELDLRLCPMFEGLYTLGLILKYRPDISIIPMKLKRRDKWPDIDLDLSYSWLKNLVDAELNKNKKVLLVFREEYITGNYDTALTEVLNSYQDQPVYFVTEMDKECQKLYTFQHQFRCKILELPFCVVNDAIVYDQVRKILQPVAPETSNYNYLCMVGRPEEHKFQLVRSLKNNNLSQYGLITVSEINDVPNDIIDCCIQNKKPPRYSKEELLTDYMKEAAQVQINGIWCSSNVENFFHIEGNYDMPLIVHSESTVGIFPATEKSMWPALLGKLYLIHGHPGIMSWIQRFHGVDQRQWANVDFDSIDGYTKENHAQRLQTMIESNRQLLTSAAEIYQQLKPKLEESRSIFVQNLYSFFASQVDSI